jgi:hypothetical protein
MARGVGQVAARIVNHLKRADLAGFKLFLVSPPCMLGMLLVGHGDVRSE